MKKFIAGLLLAVFLMGVASPSMAINANRGGIMGFIAGCCFGIRTGAAYNDGKEVHWRQWGRIVPFVGIVLAIWDGIDGANGVTTKEYAVKYGTIFY